MISKQEKVKKGLKCCGRAGEGFPKLCTKCPYNHEDSFGIDGASCQKALINDAYEVFIKQKKEEKQENKISECPMYVIKIYNKKQQDVFFDEEDMVPLIERTTNSPAILLHLWRGYLMEYEGYIYCIKDVKKGVLITNGIMKPTEIHKLQSYFYNSMED